MGLPYMRAGRLVRNNAGSRHAIAARVTIGRPRRGRSPRLLGGAAADAAGAFDDPVADDRHRTLAHDHMAARARARCRAASADRPAAISPLARPNAADATALPWLP